jgi:Icc-related predicted phosphoesterase
MRALAIADVHGAYSVYHWLVRTAQTRRPDVVVLAGDLFGCPEGYDTVEDAQRADGAQISKILEETDTPVYYIMGNDDLVEWEPNSERVRSVHGQRVELDGFNIVGYQYSLPFMGGMFEKPEDQIRHDLMQLQNLVDSNTLLLTHSPAFGALDRGILNLPAGSRSILELVEIHPPAAHIHGHVHEQFGQQSVHFNVAAAGNKRAMLIDLVDSSHQVLEEDQGAV